MEYEDEFFNLETALSDLDNEREGEDEDSLDYYYHIINNPIVEYDGTMGEDEDMSDVYLQSMRDLHIVDKPDSLFI